MKIALADVSSPHLSLDFSTGEKEPKRLSFSQVHSLGGKLEVAPHAVIIDAAELIALTLARATWTLPSGTFKVEGPTNGEALEVDLRIATSLGKERGAQPLVGTAKVGSLAGEQFAVDLGGRHTRFGITIEQLAVEATDDGVQKIAVGRIELRELQTSFGNMVLRISALELTGVTATIDGAEIEAAATGGGATGITLSGGDNDIALRDLTLPQGLSYADDRLSLPALEAGLVEVSSEALGQKNGKKNGKPAEPEPTGKKKPLPVDLRLLDQLNGKIDVDLGVDISLPVLGGRDATHHFRIEVQHGTIDFKELEGDLATLEDAFIDFRVKGDRLILERDIPLLPGDGKPILIWHLEEQAEIDLARRKRVRLRRLKDFVPAQPKKPKKENQGKPAVQLRALELDNIDVVLSMSQAAAAASLEGASHDLDGWVTHAGLGELRLSGSLAYLPGKEPRLSSLAMAGRELEVAIAGVPAGKARIDELTLSIGVIENARIKFRGVAPRAVEAALRKVALTDVRVALKAESD